MKRICLQKNTIEDQRELNTNEQNTCESHPAEILFNEQSSVPKEKRIVNAFNRMKQVCFRKTTNEHESHCTLGHKLVPSASIKTNFRIKTTFIPLFLFAALLLSVTTVQAQSSGNVNENITWTFADDTLTLSGTGPMPNYGSLSDVPWYNNYSLAITKVEIGAGITTIGSYAFGDLPYLTSVTIPNGITSIGEYAFQGCNNLTTITLPEGLLTIGDYAFYFCLNLTSVTLPESVTSIGMGAFGLCSMSSITLPEGLLTIGDGAFVYCSQLVSLNIPPNITNIGDGTFNGCSKLASITLPEGVATVGNSAFQYCSALATIRVLSATPPAAGNLAFNLLNQASCKLIVPSGAKAAYQAAAYWQGFTNISEVEYSGTTGPLSWILTSDGTLVISGKGDMPDYKNYPNSPYSPWYAYRASIKTVVIQEGVTSIGENAFGDTYPPFYAALTQVSIPSSVTRIGREAFSNCRALASATIPAGVTSIGFYAFQNTAITSVTIPAGMTRIEISVFSNCSNLASITFLGNITSIGSGAFNNTGFTSFTIPGSVTSIEQYTFQNCIKLTSVTIPNSITSIGVDAFRYCTALATVTIGNGITYWGLEGNAFSNCTALTTVRIFTLTPPSLDYKDDVFYYINPACVLEVPSESKNLYMAVAGWKQFTTINEIVDPDLASSVVSASIASSTSITINGTITNSSSEAKNSAGYYCAYGTDPNNLNQNTATQYGTVPASGSLNVSTTISGLTNGTLYYYKLVAVGNRSAPGKIFLSNPIPTSNLKLWLRADLAVTSASSAVSAWGDVSGWNNDASQGTSGNQPTVAEGAINAKPALSFNGTTSKLTLPTSTSLGLQSTPYEMFIVAKSSSSDIQFLIAGGATEQFEYHLNGVVGARFIPVTSIFVDQGTAGAYTNGSAHVFSARTSASAGVVRIDGNDVGASGVNTLSSNSGNLLLGGRSDNMYYLNGSIAEVIIYDTNLSNEERNAVEQYLADRYNISQSTFQTEGNWSVASNWSNGVPGTGIRSIIDANCTVDGNYEVADLIINSEKTLTIAPNQTLTVNGTLTNHADSTGLVIQSTASGTGRLINGTGGVRASVQQFIAEDHWHYMGIPFAGTPTVVPALKGLWVMGSDEPTATHGTADGWAYLQASDQLSSGNGFAVYHDIDTTVTIYGTLNAGGQTVPVTRRDGDHGWNLISNPFPCVVDWDYVRSNGGLSGVNDAIYVYDAANASYATYIDGVSAGSATQNQYIAPMQGFFVRATADGSVVFSENAKSTGTTSFKSNNLGPVIRLTVTSPANKTDNMIARITSQSTGKFDGQYDAYKLLSTGGATPQLYTAWNGDDYSVNSIPELTEGTVIPLKVLAKQDGGHTLALTELSNYGYTYPVMLYNPVTGERVNLETEDYHFMATTGETVDLKLLFSNDLTAGETVDFDNVTIRLFNHQLQINGLGQGKSTIRIYNINGQVFSKSTTNRDCFTQDNIPNGVLLVRVEKESERIAMWKVLVK